MSFASFFTTMKMQKGNRIHKRRQTIVGIMQRNRNGNGIFAKSSRFAAIHQTSRVQVKL